MMGSAQHGHMATVGYDLYCRMLEDTIKLIKGEIDKEPIETTIDLRIDAYIPSSYIEDEIQKIEVYKKIAAIENINEYNDVKEELIDRYSDIPDSVNNLMDIAYIKSRANTISIEEIKEIKDEVVFKFAKDYEDYKKIFLKLLSDYKENVLLKFGDKPEFRFNTREVKREDLLEIFKTMFDKLLGK